MNPNDPGLSMALWPSEWQPPEDLPSHVIEDGQEYHRALFVDGDPDRPRGWHRENVEILLGILEPFLKSGAVGLDYASGTGGSSLPLLRFCDELRISISLALTDVMPSWFNTAYQLMHERADTHFFLLDLKKARPLVDTFGEHRFDFIVSASTVHLLPETKLPGICQELFDMLQPGGTFVFNSGDLAGDQPANAALLHDVYRRAKTHLHADPAYQTALEELEARDPEKHRKVLKAHAVFPDPFPFSSLDHALRAAGFEQLTVEHPVINKSRKDAWDFIQVQRLTSIAGAIADVDARRTIILEAMEKAWRDLEECGQADPEQVRTWWTFGTYRK